MLHHTPLFQGMARPSRCSSEPPLWCPEEVVVAVGWQVKEAQHFAFLLASVDRIAGQGWLGVSSVAYNTGFNPGGEGNKPRLRKLRRHA